MTNRSHISITAQQGQAPLSAPQKKFNKLVQSIDEQRKLLASWQAASALFDQRYARELDPLAKQLDDTKAELVQFLDGAYAQKGLTKTDRKHLAELICDLAQGLMRGPRREAMKEIHDRYSDTDFDTIVKEAEQRVKSDVAGSFGMDLPDEAEEASLDDFMRMVQEKLEAQQAEQDLLQEKIAAEKAAHRSQHRKKSAREVKREAAEKDASQSLREVFRKLASALHPDRETDPAERVRKTALMQRVNQAYANKNLLDMLQLQIEAEQIDSERINNLSAERLRHYNQVLTDQLRELQMELRDTEEHFKMRYGISPYERITPSNMLGLLRDQVHLMTRDIHQSKAELRSLDDPKTLKLWIKLQVRMAAAYDTTDDFFE